MLALIDCNNFFVSCERLFRPDTRGMPVVVMSSNDGCAVARSNEAKSLGVTMGEPLYELKQRFSVIDGTTMVPLIRSAAPPLIVFSANFDLYGDISRRVAAVLIHITPRLELYSIDEAFLDIGQLDITDYTVWGRALAAQIEREVGVPVSVGIAPTKTLCKLAADYAKRHAECQSAFCIDVRDMRYESREEAAPLRGKDDWIPGQAGNDGCAAKPVYSTGASEKRAGKWRLLSSEAMRVPQEGQAPLQEWKTVFNMTPIADIWGIGWRLAPRLRAEGIHTAADLASMAPRRAEQLMGIHGRRTVAELNGISCIPLSSLRKPQQVISRGRQFGRDTNDFETISAAIARMTNHACQALRREGLLATHATVWLMTNRKKPGFTVAHSDVRLYTPTADTGHIAHQLLSMLRRDFDTRHAWHKVEVTLWDLVPNDSIQIDVFGTVRPDEYTRSATLMAALDAINQKHGKGSLRYAAEDLSHAWYPRRAMQSPLYTTDWKQLPTLYAGGLADSG